MILSLDTEQAGGRCLSLAMVVSNFQFIPPLPAEPDRTINNLTGTVMTMAAARGCEPKEADAGTVVVPQNSTGCPMIHLIEGIMGAVVHSGPKRMMLHAFVEGDAFADVESFIEAGPGIYGIEALTKVRYVEIPRAQLEPMIKESVHVREWIRLHHLRIIMQLSRRIVTLAATSPAARYRHFVNLYPDLVNRLPQYQIASILGISAESLSRVRGRLSRKK
jgi:CRP-like cAMP-binding protein